VKWAGTGYQPNEQVTAGAAFVPLQEAKKPKLAVAPPARLPFQETFRAVIVLPDWVTVAFQAWETCCPLPNANVAVQPVDVAVPPFFTVTSPWKPPVHWETTL